jgi:hypothetical protein
MKAQGNPGSVRLRKAALPKAFREKPESQLFVKRTQQTSVARVSPSIDVSG